MFNGDERNMIRKMKESTKEFRKLALVILDQVLMTQSFAILIPNVPVCALHRLVLIGIFRALMNAFTFLPREFHENPPDNLIVTKGNRNTLPVFNNKAFLDFIDKIS